MNRVIAWTLRRFTDLDVRDYVALMELANGFAVTEMLVEKQDWLENKSLVQLRLTDEGILVLGIRPSDGDYHGTPTGDTVIRADDTLILYGELERIKELDRRRAGWTGDLAHREAVEQQDEIEEDIRKQLGAAARIAPGHSIPPAQDAISNSKTAKRA